MDVNTKSTGQLVDEICTISQRLWHAQDSIATLPDAEAGQLAKKMLAWNATRTALMAEITRRIDKISADGGKTYA